MIQTGDIVRVLARGVFFGQVVRVVAVDRKKSGKTWYRLATTWKDVSYFAWFGDWEIQQEEEKTA